MVYFRFKILLKLGNQNDPSLAEVFQGGVRELGEIYSCSKTLKCLSSLPHCSMDHQVCSHVHSACDCHASDKTPGHHQHYLQLPQSASAKVVCNLSWAKPTDQHRGQHDTLRGETVQTQLFTRFLHGRGSGQKHEGQNSKPP